MKLFFKNKEHQFAKKPFTVNCLCSIYGAVVYIIIFIIYSISKGFIFEIKPRIFIPSIYSGILITSVGFGLLTFCTKHSSPMISSCSFSMQIATTLMILRFLSEENLHISQYVLTPFLICSALVVILSPILKK